MADLHSGVSAGTGGTQGRCHGADWRQPRGAAGNCCFLRGWARPGNGFVIRSMRRFQTPPVRKPFTRRPGTMGPKRDGERVRGWRIRRRLCGASDPRLPGKVRVPVRTILSALSRVEGPTPSHVEERRSIRLAIAAFRVVIAIPVAGQTPAAPQSTGGGPRTIAAFRVVR